ncbi:hypothetical protein Desac_1804 [Desulfobacca acetoxidans DSM 11109]|uniref:Phage baseplate protein n=1 Tax=Desulfobacca acetoxidans (strain ATCC 700848 / DSM 11109 / ASRB2) TaxID=880072 RepID=F2NI18_DESAR|nr:hypothetical protein Desac_1804 [Desulfobacca acetoxidans DSM 11109]
MEFRPLTGYDERSIDGLGLFDALALIDRLNRGRPGGLIRPGEAKSLAAAVRDRVLAVIYTENYGNVIAASPRCAKCGELFDLSFLLSDMLQACPLTLSADGIYQTADGGRFRLPTGEDELATFGLAPEAARQELLRRCMLTEDADPEAVEAAMEAVAPLLSKEIEAACPECGSRQTADFDLGTYLLRRLLSDKERLPGEVHTLAQAYGWGLKDILSLTRSERRRHLTLIEASAPRSWARQGSALRRRSG